MNKDNKIVPELRFPEFQNNGEWKKKKLGDFSELITKKTGTKKYKLLSVTAGVGLVSQMEKFGREIAGESYKNYYVIQNGDFAYNKSSVKVHPEGQIALLENEESGAVPNSIFTCFRVDKDVILPTYLKYPFENNIHGIWLRNFIAIGARANGALNVDNKHLLSLPVPIPSLAEQQKIASCLSSLDELIAAQTKKLEVLKDHKKGLMQQLFPAEGETVPQVRFKEFENDGEWVETILDIVADYENGKAHENDIVEAGKYILVNSKFISTDGEVRKFTDSPFCLASKDDILMVLSDVPNGRAIAKCFIVDKDELYTVNQRICKLTPKGVVGIMLYYTLNRHPYLLSFDDGVKQTNLRKEDVLNCPIVLPKNPDEQKQIANVLISIDEQINTQASKIDELKEHKRGLMQGLFPNITE